MTVLVTMRHSDGHHVCLLSLESLLSNCSTSKQNTDIQDDSFLGTVLLLLHRSINDNLER